jgi:hypothetical protein
MKTALWRVYQEATRAWFCNCEGPDGMKLHRIRRRCLRCGATRLEMPSILACAGGEPNAWAHVQPAPDFPAARTVPLVTVSA